MSQDSGNMYVCFICKIFLLFAKNPSRSGSASMPTSDLGIILTQMVIMDLLTNDQQADERIIALTQFPAIQIRLSVGGRREKLQN